MDTSNGSNEDSLHLLRKERTVLTTQTTVSTRPQPLRRLQWRRLRPLLQTAQKNTNTTGTALKAGEPAYTIPIPTRNWYHLKSTRFEYTICSFSLSSFLLPIPTSQQRRHHQHADQKTNEANETHTRTHNDATSAVFLPGRCSVPVQYDYTYDCTIIIYVYNK